MSDRLPARVGINAIFLLPGMGGLETYVRELVPELVRAAPRTRFALYCSPAGRAALADEPWAGEVACVAPPAFGRAGLKAIEEMTVLGAIASRRDDLLHSVALTAPLRTRAANVVMIADTTWFDGPRSDRTTLLWRAVVPLIARRADRLIAISQAGRRDIERHLRVPADRIDVTLLGDRPPARAPAIDPGAVRARFDLGTDPFILMLGTRKPHKNVEGALRALSLMPDRAVRLVLAGNPTALEPSLQALAAELGVTERVRFEGFVTPEEREGLYAAATCLLLPSHNEGFGLPVLEAMSRGVAVACSDAAALPEVGGDAALYFDPDDPAAIAAVLSRLLGDSPERRRLQEAGPSRAAGFTWAATAAATLESYERAWSAARSARR